MIAASREVSLSLRDRTCNVYINIIYIYIYIFQVYNPNYMTPIYLDFGLNSSMHATDYNSNKYI